MTSFGTYTLNTGSYYGNGYATSPSAAAQSNGYKRTASSINLKNIARDLQASVGSDAFYEIDDYLDRGDIDSAFKTYNEMLEQAKEKCDYYGYEMSDPEIKSALLQAYENETGINLRDKVSDSTSGSFFTGLRQGLLPLISGAFVSGTSRAEALAMLDGKEVNGREKNYENLGKLAGYAAVGAGLGAAFQFGAVPAIAGAVGALWAAAPVVVVAGGIGIGLGLLNMVVQTVTGK